MALKTDDSVVVGRIWFPGNPWPGGHRIVACRFSAIIHPNYGAWCDHVEEPGPALLLELELQTSDYDEDDPSDRDGIGADDWSSKIAWNNYGSCSISPSGSSQTPGIQVSDGTKPYDLDAPEHVFRVDVLPINWDKFVETASFGTYLLGHDAVADHHIKLHDRQEDGTYTLDWDGKIALAYMGEQEFKYSFHAHVQGVRFDAISLFYFDADNAKNMCDVEIDAAMTPRDFISPFVLNADAFKFETREGGVLHAVPVKR